MIAKLFVLGVLSRGPAHGYALRHEAVQDHTESWAGILPGSIYNAIHRLEDDGLVRAASREQDAGPARTVYELTSAGRAELLERVRTALADANVKPDPFDVVLRLADQLTPTEATAMLRARTDALTAMVQARESAYAGCKIHLTTWERRAFQHAVARLRFERDWTAALLEDEGRGEQ